MRLQLTLAPLITDIAIGRLLPGASIESPAAMLPARMAEARSVRTMLARRTAPSTFNKPAPCCSRFAPASGCAEYCSIALISGGVRPGFACSINATVPDTTGAAIDVPLRFINCSSFGCAVPPNGADNTG